MDTPLFSVIVPIYNVLPYLEQCLESISTQTFGEFEAILVDDGSTDGSGALCDAYAERDSRFRVIHKKNGGLVSARQAGAVAACGEYAVCLDGDDWIADDYLERFQEEIQEYHPDILCCGFYRSSEKENIPRPFLNRLGYYSRKNIEEEIFPLLIQALNTTYFAPSLCAKAFRRELYQRQQQRVSSALKIGEDGACTIPCVAEAKSMVILPDCMYYYRINLNSMTKGGNPFQWDGPKLIAQHLESQLDIAQFDFQEQLYRKTVHEVFSVVVSQFYAPKTYREITADIEVHLNSDEYYREAIERCVFCGSLRATLMTCALRKRWYWLIWLYAKIRLCRR